MGSCTLFKNIQTHWGSIARYNGQLNIIYRKEGTEFQPSQVSSVLLCLYCPHDCLSLSISTLVILRFIRGNRWPNRLRRLPCTQKVVGSSPAPVYSSILFLSGYLPCGSRFMLSKFNCNTLGWNSVYYVLEQGA